MDSKRIGILNTPTYFIGGYDRNSIERQIILNRISTIVNGLKDAYHVEFNIPLINGIPLEIAEYCLKQKIVYNTYFPFANLEEFYVKTPEIVEDLIRLNKKAHQNFWPNGYNCKYSPNKMIKCNKIIIDDSDLVIIANLQSVYNYWIPYLKNKDHIFINVENLDKCDH